jgi:hypothetical protein
VLARLTGALLSCWQGRQADAQAHLARAEEIFAEQSAFLAFEFDAVRAELAVADRDTERAVQWPSHPHSPPKPRIGSCNDVAAARPTAASASRHERRSRQRIEHDRSRSAVADSGSQHPRTLAAAATLVTTTTTDSVINVRSDDCSPPRTLVTVPVLGRQLKQRAREAAVTSSERRTDLDNRAPDHQAAAGSFDGMADQCTRVSVFVAFMDAPLPWLPSSVTEVAIPRSGLSH